MIDDFLVNVPTNSNVTNNIVNNDNQLYESNDYYGNEILSNNFYSNEPNIDVDVPSFYSTEPNTITYENDEFLASNNFNDSNYYTEL
jgi:hypothetical protein